jgi:hypothetical protein
MERVKINILHNPFLLVWTFAKLASDTNKLIETPRMEFCSTGYFKKFILNMFKNFKKKYYDVENILLYKCVYFQKKKMLYLGLNRNNKSWFQHWWAVMNSTLKSRFCHFVRFCYFYWWHNIMYLNMKIYTLIDYNIL